MILALERTLNIGADTFYQSMSPATTNAVIFEDDLVTGYFYAVDTQESLQILDALHIYNVADVIDRTSPRNVQIWWTNSGLIASLVINDYCHAVFDFQAHAGYCRNSFPEANGTWNKIDDRILTDAMVQAIALQKF